MTTPITPSAEHPVKVTPELFAELRAEAVPEPHAKPETVALLVADKAAQWGADQELEACREWVRSMFSGHPTWADELRAARRPKPPSLKEQAMARTDAILNDPNRALLVEVRETLELNRRALEALND
jgi:hypothetical protein